MNAAAAEVRQSDTDLGTVAVAPVVAVPQAPVTLFISNRRQRQEILAKIGAGVTVVSAERRTSTTAAFVPWAHPTLGKRLVVAGVEDGQPLLSDGSQFSVGRAIDWEFSDGLAVHTHTTALTRIAYLLSPVSTAPAPLVPAIDAGDDDDEDDAPLLDALAPSPEKLAAGRQRAAAEAAADFASAVKASIAAAGLPPAQALAAMGDVQEAMRQSSRLLDGALRPIGELSEEEWRAQRDHADGGISLALAIEDNEAWTTRLEAAQRHIRTRIAAETAAGRSVLAEHEWELGEALRGLRATARVLGERKARLDA